MNIKGSACKDSQVVQALGILGKLPTDVNEKAHFQLVSREPFHFLHHHLKWAFASCLGYHLGQSSIHCYLVEALSVGVVTIWWSSYLVEE